ncbi:hypothetical protein DNTS_025486, partial [Danionella cerebrum]
CDSQQPKVLGEISQSPIHSTSFLREEFDVRSKSSRMKLEKEDQQGKQDRRKEKKLNELNGKHKLQTQSQSKSGKERDNCKEKSELRDRNSNKKQIRDDYDSEVKVKKRRVEDEHSREMGSEERNGHQKRKTEISENDTLAKRKRIKMEVEESEAKLNDKQVKMDIRKEDGEEKVRVKEVKKEDKWKHEGVEDLEKRMELHKLNHVKESEGNENRDKYEKKKKAKDKKKEMEKKEDKKVKDEKKEKPRKEIDEMKGQLKKVKKGKEEKGKKEENKKKTGNKEEESNKWKWWEEEKLSETQKWSSLEHKGPYFPPEYEPLPDHVCFLYDGELMKLTPMTEEIATFYAKMLDHEYTSKEVFQNNFFSDWREEMTKEEKKKITSLSKCDFSQIHKYFLEKTEERKNRTKEEKQVPSFVLKEESARLVEEYGFCMLDGHREKIGNFKLEPPGLFRGRGEHPKMGKLKKRIQPEDVSINCSQDSVIPVPPAGHHWKRVQHDNTVTWLASWVENIQGHPKYIMLNPSSKLKGEKDWQKYETARKLKDFVSTIRKQYRRDWDAREMKTRQRGVAIYFIDKLALRAGNEKDDDSADTVGCCSLRVEHIKLHRHLDDQDYVVEFDFLGKDSIRYCNKVPVEKQVFKNLKLFIRNKDPEDDLFDRINTMNLNKALNEFMSGLTAKVFRTFNASTTLQDQLNKLTTADMTVEEKILSYNRANRAVAILCNHQRAAPKTFEKSMQALQEKIQKKKQQIAEAKKELKEAKKAHKDHPTDKSAKLVERKEKALQRLTEQLKKLQLQETDREENKVIALGTSKLNYLDPRITVAWCKKHQVPIEKIYTKTHRDKFAWAIDMTDENFQF